MRRFNLPWTVEELPGVGFVVRDAEGQALAYTYFDSERSVGTHAKLSREEALRMARWIARSPGLLDAT